MLQFEVLKDGEWVSPTSSYLLGDGRLAFLLANGERDITPPPLFRHSEATTRNPTFRRICWEALAPEEREYSADRLGGNVEF